MSKIRKKRVYDGSKDIGKGLKLLIERSKSYNAMTPEEFDIWYKESYKK